MRVAAGSNQTVIGVCGGRNCLLFDEWGSPAPHTLLFGDALGPFIFSLASGQTQFPSNFCLSFARRGLVVYTPKPTAWQKQTKSVDGREQVQYIFFLEWVAFCKEYLMRLFNLRILECLQQLAGRSRSSMVWFYLPHRVDHIVLCGGLLK